MARKRGEVRRSTGGKSRYPSQSQRRRFRSATVGITKPALKRLARRAGVKRSSNRIYEDARGALKIFLQGVIKDAVLYTRHGYQFVSCSSRVFACSLILFERSSTVTSLDITSLGVGLYNY
ncbi:hypothetical protein B0H16DRAFT_1462866 [Mycena metata]|uniref:Histone H4 n=1 Tax=Mycena metata TaxID=1033252 RepID=A0AAD7INC5_9AGAR|nr:hypothetical protein B0H16DRAFT_1462866 [Mycena metata]